MPARRNTATPPESSGLGLDGLDSSLYLRIEIGSQFQFILLTATDCGGASEQETRVATRGTYNTRQRQAVLDYLAAHTDRYVSVDGAFDMLRSQGVEIGRSTIYRTLETLVGEGMATKIVAPHGEVALYRLVNQGEEDAGQLVCVECGHVSTIDCDAFQEFSHHVSTVHGFTIDLSRTVLYGRCPLCAKKQVVTHA